MVVFQCELQIVHGCGAIYAGVDFDFAFHAVTFGVRYEGFHFVRAFRKGIRRGKFGSGKDCCVFECEFLVVDVDGYLQRTFQFVSFECFVWSGEGNVGI